jgi:hypothetical protein
LAVRLIGALGAGELGAGERSGLEYYNSHYSQGYCTILRSAPITRTSGTRRVPVVLDKNYFV